MSKKHVTAYTLIALVCGVLYPFGREIVTRQEPVGEMTVSTLTLNYVLLFVLAGAVSPWLSTKISMLRRFKRSTASGIVMITLVCTLLIVLTLAGMPMRWQ